MDLNYSSLPKELLHTIFSFLTCQELTSAVCVNSTWSSLAKNDTIWKEAIFNGSFPHHFSFEQKNIPWRQIVKKHFETKRNLLKRSCVQFTLGTRCPTLNTRANMVLRHETTSGKYCLLVWEVIESHGYSYSSHDHVATELWDLETRTLIRNYSQERLELFNDYLLEEDDRALHNTDVTLYAKFDPTSTEELMLENNIATGDIDYGYVSDIKNSDPNSHLLLKTWTNWTSKQKFVVVFDLRTGTKIFEKTYDDKQYLSVNQFYGSKVVMIYSKIGRILVLDVLTQKEISIKEPDSPCAMIAGNDLWLANPKEKCLVKCNLTTMQRQKYGIDEDISSPLGMSVFDGVIWLCTSSLKLKLIDVSSSKCRVLAQISMPGMHRPNLSSLPNGMLSCTSTSFAHILSFRDEDIEFPIQILQIETTGTNEQFNMRQGDLNSFITKKARVPGEQSSLSISSQTVFEDDSQRYCVIFSYSNTGSALNSFVDKMRAWSDENKTAKNIADSKTKLFSLVFFDYDQKIPYNVALRPQAFGPCWVIYETKVDGGWQRASPVDQWTFFKTEVGLK